MYNQIAQMRLSPVQYYPQNKLTIPNKSSSKARPIPAIIKNGKKITPNTHSTPYNYDNIWKEYHDIPVMMQRRVKHAITIRSLQQMVKIIQAINKTNKSSFRGALNIPARVSPQYSLQH
jgi:hypothetical protein